MKDVFPLKPPYFQEAKTWVLASHSTHEKQIFSSHQPQPTSIFTNFSLQMYKAWRISANSSKTRTARQSEWI